MSGETEPTAIIGYDKVYRDSSIDENFVSHIWDSGHFAKDALRTKDGRNLEVIYHGEKNDDSGADFHNAEIRIDGRICKGDVEIHVKNSHWRAHRHHTNPRYNSAILHVAMWDDSISLLTRKQNGEYIPTLVLYDYLEGSIGKLWKTIENGEEKPTLCRGKVKAMTLEAIGAVLDRAGMDRFLLRTQVFQKRLEHLEGKDEDQLLYEGIMEALGYSKNKEPFLQLAQKTPLKILVGQSPEKIQAILLGVAGLLPSQNDRKVKFDEETEEYVNRIEEIWKLFLPQPDDTQMSREQWEFKVRPVNFPNKRIAGMSYILSDCDGEPNTSLLATFRSAFSSVKTTQNLRDMLVRSASGYWTEHYTLGGRRHKETPFLIGHNRADDIVINVILPVIFGHAQRWEHRELQQTAKAVYASHGKLQDNRTTRYVANRILHDNEQHDSVINSAMRQQGLIHLYKNFCAVRNCENCLLVENI